MELWDVYDINRNKIDKVIAKRGYLNKGEYHLVVHLCIFNSKGEMLIQQRQDFKKIFPGLWDLTCGGSAIKGETSQDAITRELQEELGIKIDFSNVRPKLTVNFDEGFDDIYLITKDVDLFKLKLQEEEVKNVKWASKEEIISMIKEGKFIHFYESLITLLFDTRNQYGCEQRKEI